MIRAFVAVCALAASVEAAPARVLVVETDRASEDQRGLVARARAELTGLGFEVSVEQATDATLEQESRDDHAVAALRIASLAGSIEVYCMDPRTQQTIVRQVLIGPEGDGSIVLVRAVELVRASLLEVAARVPVAELHAVAAPVADEPLLSLEAGPVLITSAGGIGASANVSIAARWHPRRYLEIGPSVLVPTAASDVTGQAGRAEIKLSSAMAEANLVAPTIGGFELRGGIGAGVLRMSMHGVAAAAIFMAREDSVTTGLGFARVSLGRPIIDRVRIWLDLRIAVATPQPVVLFAGEPVASWGRPAMMGGLGIDVVLR